MRARTNRIVGQPGAIHAVLYHGSNSPPDDFSSYLKEGFQFKGAGGVYGYGLYTVFKDDPESQTFTGEYGPYIYKLAARLKGMIVFDHDAAVKVYGPNRPTVADQVRELSPGVDPALIDRSWETWENAPEFSSDWAARWWRFAPNYSMLPNGIIFRGRNDGYVCVLYRPENVSLLGWKKAGGSDFRKLISAGRDWRQESKIDAARVKTGRPGLRKISQRALKVFIIKDMVRIPGRKYAMSRYEVTQDLWQSVMGLNPSEFKGTNQPVENVSWNDCEDFCYKLKRLTGLPVRLPTEEEWEYAAKGDKKFEYAGSNNIDEVAWYENNSDEQTHPVGQKKPNGYGLYDMSGNVGEWTSTPQGSNRVFRGGSWSQPARSARVANRGMSLPSTRSDKLGFRLAMDLGG